MRQEPPRSRGTGSGPDAWLADLLVDRAARHRAATAWERRAAEPTTALAGVLADLAERASTVSIELAPGRWRHGRIGAVGVDCCALRTGETTSILALGAVVAVRTGPSEPVSFGERPGARPGDPGLHEILAIVAEARAPVLAWTCNDVAPRRGELASVGRDVAILDLDGRGGVAYLALASLAELSLVVSG